MEGIWTDLKFWILLSGYIVPVVLFSALMIFMHINAYKKRNLKKDKK